MKLYSLLHLNKGCRKHIVAITKILQFHTLKDIKFESSSVPNAISSVGSVDSKEGLSGMYEILRKMSFVTPNPEKDHEETLSFAEVTLCSIIIFYITTPVHNPNTYNYISLGFNSDLSHCSDLVFADRS